MSKSVSNEPTLLQMVFDVIRLTKSTTGDMSLVDIVKYTRVEPIAIVNKDLVKLKEYNNIVNGLLNIYIGYYLQAIQLLSVSYADSKVLKTLDSVSPDRSFVVENYKLSNTLALEDSMFSLPGMRGDEDEYDIKQTSLASKMPHLDKIAAVGKLIEIKFNIEDGSNDKRNTKEVTIPVNIRLLTTLTDSDVVASILTSNEEEVTFTSRLKDVIAGRINFFRDFIMVQDLIKKQKKVLFKEGADGYNEILKRYNNSSFLTMLNRGNVGYGKVSSIYMMTEEDEGYIKRKYGSGLNSKKIRDMVFDNSMALIIAVVDREWERVTIYVRDTDGSSTHTYQEFKKMTDNDSGAQIGEIIKSLSLGSSSLL